jgi:magnesium-transporting ATPase (P-type)
VDSVSLRWNESLVGVQHDSWDLVGLRMIRETCSCGAEFETDDREAIELVKSWRKTHKHSDKPSKADSRDSSTLSDNQVALGFQALYDPLKDEDE